MKSDKLNNKIIYFIALGSMCTLLILIMYNFFYRTIEVDVMKNIRFNYTNENGNATVTVENISEDLNQRTQAFLDTVEYEVSPNTNLSNGDILHVTTTFDENLAQQYHYKPVNTEAEFIVEGLDNRFDSSEQIEPSYLKDIDAAAIHYINEHATEIYVLDSDIKDHEKPKLVKKEKIYSSFLKSNTSKSSDRILSIYKLDYKTNQSIYYLVVVPNINDSNTVQKQNIYGEKAYLSQEEIDSMNYESYIQRIFGSQFTMTQLTN